MAWRSLGDSKLEAAIEEESDDSAALTDEQRAEKIAQIDGDLLAVERQEAEAVWLAQRQGLGVEHRPDISTLALLGLEMVSV